MNPPTTIEDKVLKLQSVKDDREAQREIIRSEVESWSPEYQHEFAEALWTSAGLHYNTELSTEAVQETIRRYLELEMPMLAFIYVRHCPHESAWSPNGISHYGLNVPDANKAVGTKLRALDESATLEQALDFHGITYHVDCLLDGGFTLRPTLDDPQEKVKL